MRATAIRYKKDGKVISDSHMVALIQEVMRRTTRAGFRTDVKWLNSTSIKIGLHKSSFRIDTDKLGYNARIGRFVYSPKGYKRTDTPTWDQRVEFNNIVNDVFDRLRLTAGIKSGCFIIRERDFGRKSERHWEDQTPTWMGYHGAGKNGMGETISDIVPESEARESMDSDERETRHRLQRNAARRFQKATNGAVTS